MSDPQVGRMGNIERCECGKPLTEAERLVGPVIVERERWRESARVSEDEILRLRDQLAGAVDRIEKLERERDELAQRLRQASRNAEAAEAEVERLTGGQQG